MFEESTDYEKSKEDKSNNTNAKNNNINNHNIGDNKRQNNNNNINIDEEHNNNNINSEMSNGKRLTKSRRRKCTNVTDKSTQADDSAFTSDDISSNESYANINVERESYNVEDIELVANHNNDETRISDVPIEECKDIFKDCLPDTEENSCEHNTCNNRHSLKHNIDKHNRICNNKNNISPTSNSSPSYSCSNSNSNNNSRESSCSNTDYGNKNTSNNNNNYYNRFSNNNNNIKLKYRRNSYPMDESSNSTSSNIVLNNNCNNQNNNNNNNTSTINNDNCNNINNNKNNNSNSEKSFNICDATNSNLQFSRSSVGGSKYLLSAHPSPFEPDDLIFESRFESGNLARSVKITPTYYELYLRPDMYTNRHTQWFYFRVKNTKAKSIYRQVEQKIIKFKQFF